MYKKSDKIVKREPNKNVYFIGGYVDGEVAKCVKDMRAERQVSYSVIIREALKEYFKKEN